MTLWSTGSPNCATIGHINDLAFAAPLLLEHCSRVSTEDGSGVAGPPPLSVSVPLECLSR